MFLYRNISVAVLLSVFLITTLPGKVKINKEIQYLNPLPGSGFIRCETNIIIRFKEPLNINSISEKKFSIEGSQSGEHSYQIKFPDDTRTVILKPHVYFNPGESVKIRVHDGIKLNNGIGIPGFDFTFKISNREIKNDGGNILAYYEDYLSRNNNSYGSDESVVFQPRQETPPLPADFPKIKVTRLLDTSPGYIFVCNFPSNAPYLMVLNNLGYPVLYKKTALASFDFKVQNANTFTYFDGLAEKYYSTNTSFSITDSFYCGYGYSTDIHELLLLPDNHAYVMSYDPQIVNMSLIIQGGDTAAIVVGLVIQEIDENKHVLFQWRSWDHFQITDATHENLTAHRIDYVHGNAIDLDSDGHVLISSRHMDEITKINRQTGNIIWRLGGKNNQFTFFNDPIGFSHQHAIRKLANGNYLLYDNGNFHTPPFSRAIEYKLDEINKTATLVWEYRNPLKTYGFAMGDAQRLPNGNTIIGWGSTSPAVTEVTPTGKKVFEMYFPAGTFSYRAFRHTWDGAPVETASSNTLFDNYPNPFNPITYIKYELLENSYVTLKIYDLTGKEIQTLVSENQQAGPHILEFDGSTLASSVYFCKITANNFTSAKRMVLVK